MKRRIEDKAEAQAKPAVVVGGGPIGSWVALQIMRRNPGAVVTVYERHETYQRDHVMTIETRSLTSWTRACSDDAEFLAEIFAARATCRENTQAQAVKPGELPPSVDIRTLDLERILHKRCVSLGVNFVTKAISTPTQVMDLHPECNTFVAADGAHSRMRLGLWGKGHLWRRDIYPSLDFNYEVHGQPDYLRVNTYLSMGHVYAENIGLEKPNGRTDVNIRMVVSREQYDALPQATFKQPLVMDDNATFWSGVGKDPVYGRTPLEDFQELLALRQAHASERRFDTPVTLTKIYLSQYCARRFSRTIEHAGTTRAWFLVGDAAMGMPFYRAVNSGMMLGSQLACLLTAQAVPLRAKCVIYNTITRPMRVMREGMRIYSKEVLIKTVKDLGRPVLRALMTSRLEPYVAGPLDRFVWRMKYGKRNLAASTR